MDQNVFYIKTPAVCKQESELANVYLSAADYKLRLSLFRDKMRSHGYDICIIYGDREHFSNIEYLTGYDCRFEEALLIIPLKADPTILTGNEGMAYSMKIPYVIRRVYYRNFSLQGQPRSSDEKLRDILIDAGVSQSMDIGVAGYKYFLPEYIEWDPDHTFDLPHYIMQTIYGICRYENVHNATKLLTGLDGGIRLAVHSAKEIAAAEANASKTSNCILRMLKALKIGMNEIEISRCANIDFTPWSMFPMVNIGDEHIKWGLSSPDDITTLKEGVPLGLCYGIRGSLTSRVGIAARNEDGVGEALRPYLLSFYGTYFKALVMWYSSLSIGCKGHTLYKSVDNVLGGGEHNVVLNPGHYTGSDEWVNSPSYSGSGYVLPDGAYLQSDIIATNTDPVRTAICEDPLILAGEKLRASLNEQYPQVWQRIQIRRQAMETIGFKLTPEVLPLSNINGAMFPFMMNPDIVFGVKSTKN